MNTQALALSLGQIEEKINTIYARTAATTKAAALEIGGYLLRAKEQLPHGQFIAWVSERFAFSRQTAHNMMNAASLFQGDKCQTFDILPDRTAFLLAQPSTPEPVREELLGRAAEGEKLAFEEVRERIKQARDADKKEKKVARLKPKQRRVHERKEEQRQREEEEWRARQRQRAKAAADAAAMLRERLGDDLGTFLALMAETDWSSVRMALQPASEAAE